MPERMLGDIVISVDQAARQAADYDAPLKAELERLMIHGLLHVLGHDQRSRASGRRWSRGAAPGAQDRDALAVRGG